MEPKLHVALKGPDGELKYDAEASVVVSCNDGKFVLVPKDAAAQCPFIPAAPAADGEHRSIPYATPTLQALVSWAVHYGATGVAASPLVKPCIYRDFSYVATDDWDAKFAAWAFGDENTRKQLLMTLKAAEQYKMEGLLDFFCVALGCKLRGEKQDVIIHDIMGVDKETTVTAEDIANVGKEYDWFSDATKPDAK